MTVRQRLYLSTALLALALVVSIAIGIFGFLATRDASEMAMQASHGVGEHAIPLVAITKDIKLEVVQVQQFLSDISATRGQDGLDDGLKEAEKHAEAFKADVKAAQELAGNAGLTKIANSIAEVDRAFPPFFDVGRKMAGAYVAGGPSVGNAMMPQFDALSAKMQDSLDIMAQGVRAFADGAVAQSETAMNSSMETVARSLTMYVLPVALAVAMVAFALLTVRGTVSARRKKPSASARPPSSPRWLRSPRPPAPAILTAASIWPARPWTRSCPR